MDAHRTQRVREALREELGEIIGYEMSDPRIEMVDVTEVELARDLRYAQVRVSLGGDSRRQQEALEALESARHYLRRELAGRLNLRRIPELHFEADARMEAAARVESLLKRSRKGRRAPAGTNP